MMAELDYDAFDDGVIEKAVTACIESAEIPTGMRWHLIHTDGVPMIREQVDLDVVVETVLTAAVPALLDRVRELEAEREMVDAWLHVADHDALKPCYSADPKVTFLDHVLDRLTQLADLEATVNELAPVPAFDVRELEAERDAALSTIAKVEALHQPSGLKIPRTFGSEPTEACGTCLSPWPCPTARALGSVPSTGEGNE